MFGVGVARLVFQDQPNASQIPNIGANYKPNKEMLVFYSAQDGDYKST